VGGYTLQLVTEANNVRGVQGDWTIWNEENILEPGYQARLLLAPTDPSAGAQVRVALAATTDTFMRDLALNSADVLLSLVLLNGEASCAKAITKKDVLKELALGNAIPRLAKVYSKVAQYAVSGDMKNAVDELRLATPVYLSSFNDAMKQIGFECEAAYLGSKAAAPVVAVEVLGESVAWAAFFSYDYLAYFANPALVTLVYSPPAQAKFSIAGQVKDEHGQPVPGAQVEAIGTIRIAAAAAPDGNFALPDLPAGTYTLVATSAGYRSSPAQPVTGPPNALVSLVLTATAVVPGMVGRWQTFTTKDGLADNEVLGIVTGPDDALWFGTRSGGASRLRADGRWRTFTTQNGLANNDVRPVVTGPDGAVWFGTRDGGASRLGSDGRWQTFTEQDGLADNDVIAIAAGPDGSLWFGTDGYGVSRLGPDGTWRTFTTKDGLAASTVLDIAAGPDGAVWFGTLVDGVSRLGPDGGWRTFTTQDGLANNSISAIAAGPDGAIWFATNGGVSRYQPGPVSLAPGATPDVTATVQATASAVPTVLATEQTLSWQELEGEWMLRQGILFGTTSGPSVWRESRQVEGSDSAWQDYSSAGQFQLDPQKNDEIALLFRVHDTLAESPGQQDQGHYYQVSVYPSQNNIMLYRISDGATAIQTVTYRVDPGQWYGFRIEVHGTSMRFLVDNQSVLESEDLSDYPKGGVGVKVYGSTIGDFKDLRLDLVR